MEEDKTPTKILFKPYIKLIAGKPTTKTGNKRKYGWEIKFSSDDNPTKENIEEIKKLNDSMIEEFGEKNEGVKD